MTVEWSTFSYECVVLKALVELVEHVKFKLRSFGITMVKFHATNIYCDNKSVENNTLLGESNLYKNSSSVVYHYMWYILAENIITMEWIETKDNMVDTYTNGLAKHVRDYLFGDCIY